LTISIFLRRGSASIDAVANVGKQCKKGTKMKRVYYLALILALLLAIDAMLLARSGQQQTFGHNLATPLHGLATQGIPAAMIILVMVALMVLALIGIKLAVPLYRLRRYLYSAEFELMEKYGRWRNSDGGTNKVKGNLELFQQLVEPTIRVNDRKVESAIFANTHPPVNIFAPQADKVYDSRVKETDKAAARKNAVRLNASMLRLILFGSQEVAREKLRLLSFDDRVHLTASILVLIQDKKLTTTVNISAAKAIWRFPRNLSFQTAEGELTGAAALMRMATL